MNPNLLTLIAFVAFVLLGLFLMTAVGAYKRRPAGRVRSRLRDEASNLSKDPARQRVLAELERAQTEARKRRKRQALGGLGQHLMRIETVGGRNGLRWLMASGLVAFVLPAVLMFSGVLTLPWWLSLLMLLGTPVWVMTVFYTRQVARFRLGFLNQLPDAIDLIIRASQAGVPVSQSIRAAGEEFPAPVGPEFRRMGDSLYLGNDLADVLSEATARIETPDFSFLAVCLLLQRDTGGSLAESLSNLSGIIRSRRDLRLKTRALTAEGRLAGGILAVMPLFITGGLYLTSPEYIEVLFETDQGRNILMTAGVMLVLGVLLIRKIARMEV